MRLVYAPLNEPGSEQLGPEAAFRRALGFDNVRLFDYRARARSGATSGQIGGELVESCVRHKANVVHLQVQDSGQIPASSINEIRKKIPGVIITQWNGDVRQKISPYQSSVGRACDLTLISSTGQIDLYRSSGASRVKYWQVGIDPDMDVPSQSIVETWHRNHTIEKIVFLANNYGEWFPNSNDRRDLVYALRESFGSQFGLYGNSWPKELRARFVAYRNQGIVSAGALVTIGMNHFRGLDRYYSDRTALAIASGSCHLLDYVPGIEEEYIPGQEIDTFKTIPEAIDKIRGLMETPGRAKAIGKAGQRRALKDHTWDCRIKQYIEYVGEIT